MDQGSDSLRGRPNRLALSHLLPSSSYGSERDRAARFGCSQRDVINGRPLNDVNLLSRLVTGADMLVCLAAALMASTLMFFLMLGLIK